METTHVLASFNLQPITFCEDSSKVDTSPITISSLVKEKSKVFTNPRVLQDDNQAEKAKEQVKRIGTKNKEKIEEKLEVYAKLDQRVKSLEEWFFLFSKFSLKVTHTTTTTLQLLAQEKEETGWTWRIISSSLSFLLMIGLRFYWLRRERKKLRNKLVVLRDHWILVVLCYLVVIWFADIQLLLGLGLAWLCQQFYIMNYSSMISIIDFYNRIDISIYSSMLVSSLGRTIVVNLLLSFFLLQ